MRRGALALGVAGVLAAVPPVVAQVGPLVPLAGEPAARFALPPALFEISGLSWHPDGYLLAHDDEVGVVHVLDPETGRSVERLGLGRRHARGDFEGVALLGDGRIVVATSFAELVRRAPDGSARSWRTDVEDVCEVEGLDVAARLADGERPRLVMACKEIFRRPWRSDLLLMEVSGEEPGRGDRSGSPHGPGSARVLVRIEADTLEAAGAASPFLASGVAVIDGGYLVLSARNRTVVHVDTRGHVWGVVRLDRGLHEQPEGIAVDREGGIWIADEGGDTDRATLTRYGPAGAGPN